MKRDHLMLPRISHDELNTTDGNDSSYLITLVTSLLLHEMLVYGFCCVVVYPIELLYQRALNKMAMQLGQDKLKITSRTSYWKIN